MASVNAATVLAGRPTIGLRLVLSLLILAALLVPLLLLGVAVWRAAEADRQTARQSLLSTAQILAGMFESTLEGNAAIVRAMARQPAELPLGPAEAAAIRTEFQAEITPDATLAPVIADTRSWSISNLFDVAGEGMPRLAMAIDLDPLAEEAQVVTLVADPRALARRLDIVARFSALVVVAVVDGNGRILARSQNQDQFIGRQVPSWQELVAVGERAGTFEADLLEGGRVTFGFGMIGGTPGWAVVIGEPKAAFDARWREPLLVLLAGGVLALLGSVLVVLWLAGLIARPISRLVQHAQAVAAGQGFGEQPRPTAIMEFELLRRSQLEAQQALIGRAETERHAAAELAVSKQRYRAIAQAGALVTMRCDSEGLVIEAEGWEALTGQPASDAMGRGWMRYVHLDDIDLLNAAGAGIADGQSMLDVELRVLVDETRWLWTRLRCVRVKDADGATLEWVGTLEDIDLRRQRQEQLSHMALHDGLTGLANRQALRDRLGSALDDEQATGIAALLYIDLDLFKLANDRFGHAVGDAVLAMVAGRLRGLLRPADMPGRLGGDEFAVVLAAVGSLDAIELVARRVVRALGRPFEVDGQTVTIGASVGVALIRPGRGDVDSLFADADRALYAAKEMGRNCHAFAEDGLSTLAS